MEDLYTATALKTSKIVTESYSTSFSYATGILKKEHRNAIYAIYGFVRFADEIVDTFHSHDKKLLLGMFESDLKFALENGISLNPVLHSFQMVVKKYNIPHEYIDAFLESMKFDLDKKEYNTAGETGKYIYGSAEVVGLMCLCVFCNGDEKQFNELREPAKKLGAAFQKVNFLRDLKNDYELLGRNYFPGINTENFDETAKKSIISDIKEDFREAFSGIKKLPADSKKAVFLAYLYYRVLLEKLENTTPEKMIKQRIRISNFKKIMLLLKVETHCKLNLL
jgi:15-cis-phytoene synthase